MNFENCIPSLYNYVAKYMDEEGCSFEEACEDLHVKEDEFINETKINLK